MPCCLLPGRSLALVSTTFFEVTILTTAVNSIPASSLLQFLEKSLPQKGKEVSHRPLQSPHGLKFPLGCCLNLAKGEDDSSLWNFLHTLMTGDDRVFQVLSGCHLSSFPELYIPRIYITIPILSRNWGSWSKCPWAVFIKSFLSN